jgi:hypothetical protein
MLRALALTAVILFAVGCVPLSFTTVADETVRRTDEISFSAAAGDVVVVTSEFGSIKIAADAQATPSAKAEISASAPEKAVAEALLARYRAVVEEAPGRRTIRLVGEPLEIKTAAGVRRLTADVSFTVTVPPGTRWEAKSGSGSVSGRGAAAGFVGESSFGSVQAEGVRGPVRLVSGSGSVTAVDCREGDAELISDFGSVTARRGKGKVRVRAGSGSVTVDDWTGEVAARADFGSVTAAGVFAKVDLSAGSGSVTLTAAAGSEAKEPWSATSEFGSIRCTLPADFSAAFDAETSFGSLRLNHPGLKRESSGEKKRCKGELGRGGPVVRLKCGSGSVTLEATDR